MADISHEDHCSRWSGIPQAKQTEFTRRAVGLLVTAFRTGVYNLPVLWKRVDWRYGNGVSFILGNRPALASWDFNQLTRLVIGAHDECIRVEVEPHGFGYLKINMWPRKGRDGTMFERHPSIEDAISDFRTDNSPPSSHENFATLVSHYGENPTQDGFDAIYWKYLADCESARLSGQRTAFTPASIPHVLLEAEK